VKAAGGIQLVAGGDSWWLQVVVAFFDLLDGLSLIQHSVHHSQQKLCLAWRLNKFTKRWFS